MEKVISVQPEKAINTPDYRKSDGWGVKTFSVSDCKIFEESGAFYITGYANIKNTPDSYGDIPTNYGGQPVYNLSRYVKNPVILINHDPGVENVAGIMVELTENEIGLYFKGRLINIEDCHNDCVAHAVAAVKNGFIRAISIGGRWFYEDSKNPNSLTRADIYEISIVSIPASEDSLIDNTQKPKSAEITHEKIDENADQVNDEPKKQPLKDAVSTKMLSILKAKTRVNIWKGYRK